MHTRTKAEIEEENQELRSKYGNKEPDQKVVCYTPQSAHFRIQEADIDLVVTGDELEQKKKAVFCEYLGDKNGRKINEKLFYMYKRLGDSSRREHKLGHVSNLYPVVDELEMELLSKLTKHKCKREN